MFYNLSSINPLKSCLAKFLIILGCGFFIFSNAIFLKFLLLYLNDYLKSL